MVSHALSVQRAIGIQAERAANKDQLILPADAVEEDDRKAGFRDPCGENLFKPPVVLVDFIRAAID